MAAAGTRLPDALIRQGPMIDNVVAEADQDFLHFAIQMMAMKSVLRGGVNHFSVHVELHLVARAVANAYRTGSAVAGEPIQSALLRRQITVNVVEDAQFRLGKAGGLQHPIQEIVSLFPIT